MKENDALTGLFRSRLSGAELPVREGTWEKLRQALPPMAATGGKRAAGIIPLHRTLYRVAAAAAVLLVLGGVSAAFWYFSPKEEIEDAFTQAAAYMPEAGLDTTHTAEPPVIVQPVSPGGGQAPSVTAQAVKPSGWQAATTPRGARPAGLYQAGMNPSDAGGGNDPSLPASGTGETGDDDETVSVHFSITITEQVFDNGESQESGFYEVNDPMAAAASSTTPAATGKESQARRDSKWALKAGIGTALPKGDYHAPLTAGLTVERSLGSRVAVEAGLQYHRMEGDGTTEHRLSIPLSADVLLASASRFDLYATAGVAVEKCVAGAPDNSFSAEPVQWSVAVGLGARYKMGDRFALFAEPTVTHHFSNGGDTRTLRSERSTNLNLLCGVRMSY
ncbi:MAG: porin family protein [Prevotellaceae bacterium]|nr:porin family protein [Prevotellaceae bacterium]